MFQGRKHHVNKLSNIFLKQRSDGAIVNILIFGILWKASMLYKLHIHFSSETLDFEV